MANEDLLDTDALPKTEPYLPTFDTDAHHIAEPEITESPARRRRWWRRRTDAPATEPVEEPVSDPAVEILPTEAAPGPLHAPAPPIVVPSRYHFVKWWQFMLMLLAVWLPAGATGAGLFYWWTHDYSAHKTAVVFVVLVYIVVCTVAGLMLAMVPDRPLVSTLAIAMMSAMCASVVTVAPLYGAFYCEHSHRPCLVGVIPH
jgi:hypothetical protein